MGRINGGHMTHHPLPTQTHSPKLAHLCSYISVGGTFLNRLVRGIQGRLGRLKGWKAYKVTSLPTTQIVMNSNSSSDLAPFLTIIGGGGGGGGLGPRRGLGSFQ